MNEGRLARTGIVYIVFAILTQLINFFLIGLYTKNLSTIQYGEYAIIMMVQGLLAIFVTLGVFSGLARFLNEYSDQNQLKNTAITFSVSWGILLGATVFLSAPLINTLVFDNSLNGISYIRYIYINSLLLCLISVYSQYYLMQYKALLTSTIETFKLALTLILAIYFLKFLNKEIIGVLQSQLLAYSIVLLTLIINDIKQLRFEWHKDALKEMLSFGLGLVPGQASAWVLNLIGRYFLKVMINLSTVAVYSLGCQIGMLLQAVFVNAFAKAFTPYKFEVYKEPDGPNKIARVFTYYNAIGWFCVLGLALFARVIIHILATPAYTSAFKIVPIIAFSYLLCGMNSFYSLGLVIGNKMLLNSGAFFVGAVINVALNFLLVPHIDMYGAALAMVLSYLVVNILYYHLGQRYYKLHLSIVEPVKFGAVFLLIYAGYYLLVVPLTNSLLVEFFISTFLCCLYPIIITILGFISVNDIKMLVKVFKLNKGELAVDS